MHALLLCAGSQRRFKGRPEAKQLVTILGEPVLDRTIRQLRDLSVTGITVISANPDLQRTGAAFFTPDRHRWLAETMLSSRPLWSGRTLFLLGDVVFSDKAIQAMVTAQGNPRFMGRAAANPYTMCPWSELFGLVVDEPDFERVEDLLNKAIAHGLNGGPGKLSCVYAAHLGVPFQSMQHGPRPSDPTHFLAIDDWTDDMDFPNEYENMVALHDALTPEISSPAELLTTPDGVASYLSRADRFRTLGQHRWARVGYEFVLSIDPGNKGAQLGLEALPSDPEPVDVMDDDFWDRWTPVPGVPHPATQSGTFALDRIGKGRLTRILATLRRLAEEGADWAGATGRTLHRILSRREVTDTEILALSFVLLHALKQENDLDNFVLEYPE